MLSLVAAFTGSSARADAESESPFSFDPPAGWAREVAQDGRVNYRHPENSDYCFIQIQPVIPKDLSMADDFWLLQFFDAELRQEMSVYARRGILVPYNAERPFFKTGSVGKYIYKELSVNMEDGIINHQIMFAFKDGQLQEFISISDVTRCPNCPSAAKEFFGRLAYHLE